MEPHENDTFGRRLAGVMEAYNRAAPTAEARAVWWRILRPYPLDAVSQAFGLYTRTEPKFPPTPAQILELLGEGGGDNRPTADEAWAVALRSRDEADTVVWTDEAASAFATCRPVLHVGDEVGARMAFKAAYDRLVTEARRRGVAPRWQASLGWDTARREASVNQAVLAGHLPAPTAAALLPAPGPAEGTSDAAAARVQTQKILALLAEAPTPAQRRQQAQADRAAAERQRLAQLKANLPGPAPEVDLSPLQRAAPEGRP